MFRSLKIIHKITLAYILFIIVPLSIITSISYYQYYQKERNTLVTREKAQLNELEQKIINNVTVVEDISSNILRNTRLLNYLNSASYNQAYTSMEFQNSISSIFEYSLLIHKLNFHSVKLFLNDDRITNFDHVIHSEYELLNQSWYIDFIHDSASSVWLGPISINYLVGPMDNTRPVYSFCQKLVTEDGTYRGVLILSITQDTMLTKNLVLSDPSTSYHILDVNGKNVLNTDQRNITLTSEERNKLINQTNYIYSEKNKLFIWNFIPQLKLYLGISQTLDNPLFLTRNKFAILSLLLFLLMAILFIFYYYIKRIFKDINSNIKEVDSIVQNNFTTRIETSRQDEIGEISHSFNVLIDKIDLLIKDVVAKETAQKDANLKALQYQINPHFIYNTIEVFSSSMELSGEYVIADAMAAFGKMLRYNLKYDSNFSTIKEELEHVKSYINIEKIKYSDCLQLSINCDESLYSLPLIRFLLQPIVENSLMHGFRSKSSCLTIHILIESINNIVYFTVTDDGIGIADDKVLFLNSTFITSQYDNKTADQNGIGLRNINERLKLFYGENHHILIKSDDKNTSVKFSLPVQYF